MKGQPGRKDAPESKARAGRGAAHEEDGRMRRLKQNLAAGEAALDGEGPRRRVLCNPEERETTQRSVFRDPCGRANQYRQHRPAK